MAYKGQPFPSTIHPIRRAKISDGKSVRVTVPENTEIKGGLFYLIDEFFGPAVQNVKTGAGETAEVILTIEQAEYETTQLAEDDECEVGALLYWDPANEVMTEEPDDGEQTSPTQFRPVGRVTVAKDENGVAWFILGPQV